MLTPLARGVAFRYGQTNGLAEYTWFVLDGLACGALLAVLLRSGISPRAVSRIALTLVAIAVVAGLAGSPSGRHACQASRRGISVNAHLAVL